MAETQRATNWASVQPGRWRHIGSKTLYLEHDPRRRTYILRGKFRGFVALDVVCPRHLDAAIRAADAWIRDRQRDEVRAAERRSST